MSPRARTTRRPQSVTDRHRAWLQLVDTDGPFVAVPALKRVYPDGIASLREKVGAYAALRDGKVAFDKAWDRFAQGPGGDEALAAYREARDAWAQTVLRDVLDWQGDLVPFAADRLPLAVVRSGDRRHTAQPSHVVEGAQGPVMLVATVDPVEGDQALRLPAQDGWAASPVDRMELMLRATGVPVGIVTALVGGPFFIWLLRRDARALGGAR